MLMQFIEHPHDSAQSLGAVNYSVIFDLCCND